MKLNLSIKEITLIGMCAALMAIFSQISIPLPFTSVPVTLQIFGLVVLAVIVGAKIGTLSIIIFIFLGAIGLPVFANFSGGFGVIMGPTGGYIFGFVLIAFLIGFASSKQNNAILFITSYIAVIADLIVGTLYLKMVTGMDLNSALIAGFYPFIIKDLITVAVAVAVGLKIKENLGNILAKNVTA